MKFNFKDKALQIVPISEYTVCLNSAEVVSSEFVILFNVAWGSRQGAQDGVSMLSVKSKQVIKSKQFKNCNLLVENSNIHT